MTDDNSKRFALDELDKILEDNPVIGHMYKRECINFKDIRRFTFNESQMQKEVFMVIPAIHEWYKPAELKLFLPDGQIKVLIG